MCKHKKYPPKSNNAKEAELPISCEQGYSLAVDKQGLRHIRNTIPVRRILTALRKWAKRATVHSREWGCQMHKSDFAANNNAPG